VNEGEKITVAAERKGHISRQKRIAREREKAA